MLPLTVKTLVTAAIEAISKFEVIVTTSGAGTPKYGITTTVKIVKSR